MDFNTEQIKQKAIFFGSDKLTEYQKKVNLASIELCVKTPSFLLGKRGDLLMLAKDKVHEDGYQYKKGKSRSAKHTGEILSVKTARVDTVERK